MSRVGGYLLSLESRLRRPCCPSHRGRRTIARPVDLPRFRGEVSVGIRVAGLGAMCPPSLAFWVHLLVRPRASFRSLIATVKASAKLSIWHHFLHLKDHFPCSAAPQAFPRPDRRMLTPARAGRVKAGRTFAATESLALIRPSTTAHWFDRACFSFCLSPVARTYDAAGCIVLFAVWRKLAAPWSSKASAPQCPDRDQQMSRKESRSSRDPSRQGRPRPGRIGCAAHRRCPSRPCAQCGSSPSAPHPLRRATMANA